MITLLSVILLLGMFLLFFSNYKVGQYKNGLEMIETIEDQLRLGGRSVGSAGHIKIRDYIVGQLSRAGVETARQMWTDASGLELTNIVGRINPAQTKRIIIGTHYDTKLGTPGANDGASGVSVLLQLAKNLKIENAGIDLVFFDAEEYEPGPFDDWRPKGSTYFSQNITDLYPQQRPESAIAVDLVCKKGLTLKQEEGSRSHAPGLAKELWAVGQDIDNRVFSNEHVGEVKDDHTPLNTIGVPSVLLIDMNYPQRHTAKDNISQCDTRSLEVVYQTIKKFISEFDKNSK